MDFSVSSERSGRSHRVIGYVIGVLGLLVSCVVIYGVGGPIFPTKHMSIGDKEKGNYENFVPIIASKCFWFRLLLVDKYVTECKKKCVFMGISEFNFLAGLFWLFAVYKVSNTDIQVISQNFWKSQGDNCYETVKETEEIYEKSERYPKSASLHQWDQSLAFFRYFSVSL